MLIQILLRNHRFKKPRQIINKKEKNLLERRQKSIQIINKKEKNLLERCYFNYIEKMTKIRRLKRKINQTQSYKNQNPLKNKIHFQ